MKYVSTLVGLLGMLQTVLSQTPCNIQAFASPQHISCGQSVTLSAFGNGSGNVAFQENFNSGSPVGWQFTQTVTIAANTCGVPSPDGSPFMWMGAASVNPRDMTTVGFDLTLGGTVCFDMRYAIQGDPSPCEGPDEPGEGVYLQYSTNGGANWTTIQYWNPNGGNDPQLTRWNRYCAIIPAGAQTANTMIRWHQDAVSGAEYDHWGIDNVAITLNDPNFVISWAHDGYSYGYGSSGGTNPTTVSPTANTTYNVQITDGTHTCTNQVAVTVTNPVIVMEVGPDTTICPGECVHLDATTYWQVEAPGPHTFVNDISQTISAGFGGGAIQIPVSVGGLNLSTIQPGSIQEVCITGMSYFGQNIFPPSTLTVGSFAINLSCPGGTSIQLVPAGVTTSTFILPGYVRTCFNMSTPNNIAASAPPYTNSFAPAQSFNNLTGCQANGTWNMSLVPSGGLGIGSGNFAGWSITFNDPGLTAPVSYSWSPTTDMTGANTLTPNVCPTQTTTYTLTATTAPGCQPATGSATITVPNSCCQLQLTNTVIQNPSCATADGQIQINTSASVTGLKFSIDNGVTYQTSNTFTGLAAGTYQIVINDDNHCAVHGTAVLTTPNAPVIDLVNVTPSSCTGNDGTITITASGGSGALSYSVDNGGTFQASGTFTGLANGHYNIVVNDQAGCSANGSATIASAGGLAVTSVGKTDPSCGQADGSITVTATGSGLQYSIDGGATYQASNVFSTLASGNYTVTVKDQAGCTVTATATLNDVGAPQITGVTVQAAPCGGGTGSLTVTATGGANMQYSIDGGASWQAGNVFTGLAAGSYTVTVGENGCQATAHTVIPSLTAVTVQATAVNDGCSPGCSGGISVQAGGGTPPYQYTWTGNIAGNTPQAQSVCAGTYTVTVTDQAGCSQNVTVNVTGESGVHAGFSFSPSEVVLPDGFVQFENLSDGADGYLWSFGGFTQSAETDPFIDFSGLAPGLYPVCLTAYNNAGCSDEHCRQIRVKDDLAVYVPNAFTPNGNHLNETFFPISRQIMAGEEYEFCVFSRWGELIFKSKEISMGWNGTYNGKPVPPDLYVWKLKINYASLPEKVILGHVSVLR